MLINNCFHSVGKPFTEQCNAVKRSKSTADQAVALSCYREAQLSSWRRKKMLVYYPQHL